MFTTIKREVYSARITKAARKAWISQATWQLADQRTEVHRVGRSSTREVQKAWRYF